MAQKAENKDLKIGKTEDPKRKTLETKTLENEETYDPRPKTRITIRGPQFTKAKQTQ